VRAVRGAARVHVATDVSSGLALARALAAAAEEPADLIVVTGSVVTVGDAAGVLTSDT